MAKSPPFTLALYALASAIQRDHVAYEGVVGLLERTEEDCNLSDFEVIVQHLYTQACDDDDLTGFESTRAYTALCTRAGAMARHHAHPRHRGFEELRVATYQHGGQGQVVPLGTIWVKVDKRTVCMPGPSGMCSATPFKNTTLHAVVLGEHTWPVSKKWNDIAGPWTLSVAEGTFTAEQVATFGEPS